MAYQFVKQVEKYTYEESERIFREDCRAQLTTEQYNNAHNLGMADAEGIETDLRKWQAYNLRLSQALFEHLGIDSWRDWKMQELGQNKKPKRVFKPKRTERLDSDQMQNLIGQRKAAKEGRKTIVGYIENKY